MSEFKAEFYETEEGKKPAKDFMLSQNPKMKAKLFGLVSILEQYGNQLREPYSKPLGDGIFELRAKVGTDISRVLYFFYYEGRIVLTHGFVKKTKKTPPSEIEYAKKCRKAFLEFQNLLQEELKDPEFKKEWDDMQPEMDVIRAMIDARIEQNLTQKELAKRTGIDQADISKLENGTRNPSLKLLKRLAHGMGMQLKIEFVPMQTQLRK